MYVQFKEKKHLHRDPVIQNSNKQILFLKITKLQYCKGNILTLQSVIKMDVLSVSLFFNLSLFSGNERKLTFHTILSL